MSHLIDSAHDLGLRSACVLQERLTSGRDRGASYVVEIIAVCVLIAAVIVAVTPATIATAITTLFQTTIGGIDVGGGDGAAPAGG